MTDIKSKSEKRLREAGLTLPVDANDILTLAPFFRAKSDVVARALVLGTMSMGGEGFRAADEVIAEADYYWRYEAIYRAHADATVAVGMEKRQGPLGAQIVKNRARAFKWLIDPSIEW